MTRHAPMIKCAGGVKLPLRGPCPECGATAGDPCPRGLAKEREASNAMLAALKNVNKLISEAAMTGFNCHDGDWAERLFASQQVTSAAIRKAEGRNG